MTRSTLHSLTLAGAVLGVGIVSALIVPPATISHPLSERSDAHITQIGLAAHTESAGTPSTAANRARYRLDLVQQHRRPRLLRGARLSEPIDAPVLQTERLTLRTHRMSDATQWFEIQSSPEVLDHIWYWPERTFEQSRRHLQDRTKHNRLWQSDDFLALAIEFDGRLIGDVGLHLRSVREIRVAEISWLLHPDYFGRGFATEAARAVLDFAFESIGAQLIVCQTQPDNHASLALARRLGFRLAAEEPQLLTLSLGLTDFARG